MSDGGTYVTVYVVMQGNVTTTVVVGDAGGSDSSYVWTHTKVTAKSRNGKAYSSSYDAPIKFENDRGYTTANGIKTFRAVVGEVERIYNMAKCIYSLRYQENFGATSCSSF